MKKKPMLPHSIEITKDGRGYRERRGALRIEVDDATGDYLPNREKRARAMLAAAVAELEKAGLNIEETLEEVVKSRPAGNARFKSVINPEGPGLLHPAALAASLIASFHALRVHIRAISEGKATTQGLEGEVLHVADAYFLWAYELYAHEGVYGAMVAAANRAKGRLAPKDKRLARDRKGDRGSRLELGQKRESACKKAF